MKSDTVAREELINLLKGGNAHMPLSVAVKDFPEEKINTIFPNGTYSAWELLEHIRITQWDILEFITNSNYQEISWPADYWPAKGMEATKKEWGKTISEFEKDNLELQKIIKNSQTNLYAKIPHGDGQNVFREILVVADHNSYHIGEFAIMRQTMKTWTKEH